MLSGRKAHEVHGTGRDPPLISHLASLSFRYILIFTFSLQLKRSGAGGPRLKSQSRYRLKMAVSPRVKFSGGKIAPRSDLRVGATREEIVERFDGVGVNGARMGSLPARPMTRRSAAASSARLPSPLVPDTVRQSTPNVARAVSARSQDAGFGLRAVKVSLVRCDEVSLRAVRVALVRCDSQVQRQVLNVRQVDQPTAAERETVRPATPEIPVVEAAPGGERARTTDVRILQLNMRRSAVVTDEVRDLVGRKRLDVLLLQEPYVRRQGQSHTFCGLGIGMQIAAVRSEKPWAAVAICNSSFHMTFISQLSTTHCACAEVLAPGLSLYVVSHYFQPSDDIEGHLRHLGMVLHSLRGKRVIVALDANSRSPLWGPQRADRRGVQVERLIREFAFEVINDVQQPPTFWTVNGSSFIDVTMVSPSLSRFVGNWNVRENWTTSDHRALDVTLRVPKVAGNDEGPNVSRFNVKRADWERFSQILVALSRARLEGLPLTSNVEVERMAEALTGVITEACTESMPKKKFYRRSNPWWTVALTNLKKGVYQKRRAFQGEQDGPRRLELRLEYRTSLREYSREVKRTKLESWRNFVSSYGNTEPWGFVYKQQANKLRVQKVLSTIRQGEGHTSNMEETASCLLDVHIPDDRVEDDTPQQREVREGSVGAPDTPDDPQFTIDELSAAVKTLKNGKAPGLDLIEVVTLKAAFAAIPGQLVRLFNGCLQVGVFPSAWKEGSLRVLLKGEDKDEKDPKSYRPICLLSVIGKLFEKLIKGRLEKTVFADGKTSGRQYGFTKAKSTENAIVEMRRMVGDSRETYTIGLLFDISGAFDNVWWPLVLTGLKDRACPRNLFQVIQNYFSDRVVGISWGENKVTKRATRGCPQGSVLGPTCWNLMFDGLLRVLEEIAPNNFVAYADDLLVSVQGNSRTQLENRAQAIVDRIVEWCRNAKLELSERKTEAILLKSNWIRRAPVGRRGGDRPDRARRANVRPNLANRYPIIRIGNTRINFKNSVRYLGVHFDKELGVSTHCANLKAKCVALFQKLARLAGTGWGLRYRALDKIYKGVFVPTVAYAAAGWSDLCKAADLRVLRTTQRLALIATTSAYRTASYAGLCVIAGALPVEILLQQSRARFDIRTGWDTRINNVLVPAGAPDAVETIKGEALNMWQTEWDSSTKGRTTYAFFENVRERMNASWFRPDYYTTQVVSGHGDFRARLASLGLADGDECACGRPETAQHFLLECPEFEPQRVALREHLGDREWPAAARQLVSNAEAFSVFSAFCREALWIKGGLNILE